MTSSNGCADPTFCRGGCCRNFFGTQFCDVESNCVAQPTWLIALVPGMLGLAAIVLIIIVIIRLKNRKIVDIYEQFPSPQKQKYEHAETDRNLLKLSDPRSRRNLQLRE